MSDIPNQISHIGKGKELSGNSSTANISDGGTFTGDWQEVVVGSALILAIKADQNLDISIQYSPDGVNADSQIPLYYRTSQIEPPHIFVNARPYVRIVVTNNSGSATTVFRLNAYISDVPANLNIPIDATMSQDYDSISVRPSDFHTEVALGRRQGMTTWNKFGYNNNVDSASPEVIASFGGTFQYITSGETIDIVSSSVNDDLVGTGVQRIVVTGVDENWDQQVEVVEMDGTTTVTTTTQWIGINRVSIFKAGSGGTNAGTITITATSSGYTMAEMPVGDGSTQQMVFYVPRNHQFLAEWVRLVALKTSGGGNPEIVFKGIVYSDINTAEQEVYRGKLDTRRSNGTDVNPPLPFPISEKSILWFTADTDTNDTQVSGRFSGELVRDIDA